MKVQGVPPKNVIFIFWPIISVFWRWRITVYFNGDHTLIALRSLLDLQTNSGIYRNALFISTNQIHQFKQEKSYFFCNIYFYFLYYDQTIMTGVQIECNGINTARAHRNVFDRTALYAYSISVWRSRSDFKTGVFDDLHWN